MHHKYTSYPTIANHDDEHDCPRPRAPPGDLSCLKHHSDAANREGFRHDQRNGGSAKGH